MFTVRLYILQIKKQYAFLETKLKPALLFQLSVENPFLLTKRIFCCIIQGAKKQINIVHFLLFRVTES